VGEDGGENARGVVDSQRGGQAAEGPEDDEPSFTAAFRVGGEGRFGVY
jgi:hypothetical protein